MVRDVRTWWICTTGLLTGRPLLEQGQLSTFRDREPISDGGRTGALDHLERGPI